MAGASIASKCSEAYQHFKNGLFQESLVVLESLASQEHPHVLHIRHNITLARSLADGSVAALTRAIDSFAQIEKQASEAQRAPMSDAEKEHLVHCSHLCSYNRALIYYRLQCFDATVTILEPVTKKWLVCEDDAELALVPELLMCNVCLLLLDAYISISLLSSVSGGVSTNAMEIVSLLERRFASNLAKKGGKGSQTQPAPSVDNGLIDVVYALREYRAKINLSSRLAKASKKEIKHAMSLGNQNPTSIFLKANFEMLRNNFPKAVRLLDALKAVEDRSEPTLPVLYYNDLACVYAQMGKVHAASFYAASALRENEAMLQKPDVPFSLWCKDKQMELLYNNGVLQLSIGHPREAFECLSATIGVYHHSPMLWLRLAECIISVNAEKDKTPEYNTKLTATRKKTLAERDTTPACTLSFALQSLHSCLHLCQKNASNAEAEAIKRAALINLAYVGLAIADWHQTLIAVKQLQMMKNVPRCYTHLAHQFLAEALCFLNHPHEALKHLSPALLNDEAALVESTGLVSPTNTMPYSEVSRYSLFHNLVLCQVQMGNLDAAHASIAKAALMCPPCCESTFRLLSVYVSLKAGNVVAAKELLTKGRPLPVK